MTEWIETEWSDEDQAYIATNMLHPYLSGIGSTRNNAIGHLKVAIELEAESMTAKTRAWLDGMAKSIRSK